MNNHIKGKKLKTENKGQKLHIEKYMPRSKH